MSITGRIKKAKQTKFVDRKKLVQNREIINMSKSEIVNKIYELEDERQNIVLNDLDTKKIDKKLALYSKEYLKRGIHNMGLLGLNKFEVDPKTGLRRK